LRKLTVLAAVVAALGLAGVANAQTWQVAAGQLGPPPAGSPKALKATFVDQFLPDKITINAGDKVTFASATFHTATYLGAAKPFALFTPDPAKTKYTGINGADGQPFWFDGLLKFVYNPQAFAPFGGTTVPGNGPVSSGALSPSGPKQKIASATFTFPKAGNFRLVCNVHPGMFVDVTVKPTGAPVPKTPAQVQAQTLSLQNAAYTEAKGLLTTKAPAKTVWVGVGSATTLLTYLPNTITVKAGTTVNFVNKSAREVHNLAFGQKKYIQQFETKYDLLPRGPKSPNQVSPALLYGSEAKGHYQYDGTAHGNGFFVTPLTTGTPGVPLPHSVAVTFTKAGTYHYFCLIHGPDMNGTVVVTP
jgi:plastocyanin